MTALAIIGCTLGGTLLGGSIGLFIGNAEGGDFNLAPVIYGPIGAALGAIVGCVIGSVVFSV